MNSVQDINRAIIANQFTIDELNSIIEAVKFARANLGRDVKRELRPGARVSFVSSRTGQRYTGTVDSVKIKNVIVSTTQGRYRVPASMLTIETA